MAILFPENINFNTYGEKLFYKRILRKLSSNWFIFYEPIIQGREPDFILLNEEYGIIIIEVKDYKSETIISFTPHSWLIKSGKKFVEVTSPLKQVINYRNILNEYLSSFDSLVDSYTKRFIFPIHTLCVFPNLTSHDLYKTNLNNLFSNFNIMLQNDLSSVENFYSIIKKSRDILFTPKYSSTSIIHEVINAIYPHYIYSYNKKHIKSIKSEEVNLSNFPVEKFPSVISEILFVVDNITNHVNTTEINLNEILIVINENRLGKYNAFRYKEILLKQINFKNLRLQGSDGIQLISYKQLVSNPHLLHKVKCKYLLDFNSTPKNLKSNVLAFVNKNNSIITTNSINI